MVCSTVGQNWTNLYIEMGVCDFNILIGSVSYLST